MAPYAVQLEPRESVSRKRGGLAADTELPWLTLRFAEGVPAGRWISLIYKSSYLDVLVRPILRFITPEGDQDQVAPAALFGRAAWIGRIPDGTREVLISPTNRAGPFGFEIESCRPLPWRALVTKAWSRDPRRTLEAIGSRFMGRRREADRLLTTGLGSVPLENYHEWRATRWRDFDLAGLDAPRADWTEGPHVRIVVAESGRNPDRIHNLLGQLAEQAYPHWSLALVAPSSSSCRADLGGLVKAGRLVLFDPSDAIDVLTRGISGDALVGSIDADALLPSYALAILAEYAVRWPAKSIFYADEDAINADGRHVDPRLKPDWSPTFEAAQHYVGSALFARGRLLERLSIASLGELPHDGGLGDLLAKVPADEIEHIRRVMLTHRRPSPADAIITAPTPAPQTFGELADGRPRATIIIPSKDQPRLLSACVRSLQMTAGPGNDEIVIVDNGSVDPKTRRLYESLKSDSRVRVMDRPGPFNFSHLCNEAAREARAPVLVFLNNDVEANDGNWLRPLLSWASRPDIGAVGAKLLYPSDRLQHGGVVIGLGGYSAHIDRGAQSDDTGYLQRRAGPHELSAVTGACLAIEKVKFDAVGGFNADDLPIELNDIDLCLRLAQRGWRTILVPESALVHHESASRGQSTTRSKKYQRERAFFCRQWGGRLRDDPYFHPSLSLVSIRTALA